MPIPFTEFLKQNTTIPKEFIDEFYSFYDVETTQPNDLIIDLEKVAKWLGTQKYKLMETLRNSPHYKEGRDYTISKVPSSNRKLVLITPTCFKHIGMMTRSSKGEETRSFFLQVEKAFYRYLDVMMAKRKKTTK